MSQKPTIKIKKLNPSFNSNSDSNSNFERQLQQLLLLRRPPAWTDVGLDRHIAANTDERGLIANTAISERENGPSNGPVDPKHPVHPPDPPHPTLSPIAEAGIGIEIGAYRLGHSDKFACHNCKQKGDKWLMEGHQCSGNGKAKSRAKTRAKTAG